MPSPVEIANRALSRIGVARVTSIDPPDDSKAARAVASAWDLVRREVLRAHPWNCVSSRASLAASGTAPTWEYDRAFPLPAGCLRILQVDTEFSWVTESGSILTDETAPLRIRYVRDEEDTEQYDAHLVNVLSSRLALELAPELIEADMGTRQILRAEYQAALTQARHTDAVEQSRPDLRDDDWITVRY